MAGSERIYQNFLLDSTRWDHLGERWSREIGPVVKVDQLAREMIQNDETKEPFA